MSLQLSAPQPLAAVHLLDEFSSGETSLDEWLRRRALANQWSGASRSFVVTDASGRVFGYYAMAAGAVSHAMATSGVRRNMPDPIPVMVLARLAVDHRAQGIKLGAAGNNNGGWYFFSIVNAFKPGFPIFHFVKFIEYNKGFSAIP